MSKVTSSSAKTSDRTDDSGSKGVTSRRVLDNMKEVTGASEEDIKAVLQQCNGDANRATELLLENPFSKVTSKKDRRKAKEHQDERRPEGAKQQQEGKRSAAPGGGRGRGRSEGRGGRGSGRISAGPAGRGPSLPTVAKGAPGVSGTSIAGAAASTSANGETQHGDTWAGAPGDSWDSSQAPAAQVGDGWSGTENWSSKPGDTWSSGTENWGTTTTAVQPPPAAQAQAAPAPAPIRPGVGFADILKGRGAKPAPVAEPVAAKPAVAGSSAPGPAQPTYVQVQPQPAAPVVEEAPAPQPVQDQAPAASVQPVAVVQQPYQPIPQAAVGTAGAWGVAENLAQTSTVLSSIPSSTDNALTAADVPVSVPSSTQYGAYGDDTKSSSAVDSLQLTFGNFSLSSPGLGDFGAGFGTRPAYDMQYQQAETTTVAPKQPVAQSTTHASEVSVTAAPAADSYKPTYPYGLHAAADKVSTAAVTAAAASEQSRPGLALNSASTHPGATSAHTQGYNMPSIQQTQNSSFPPSYRLDTFSSDTVESNNQSYGTHDFGAGFGNDFKAAASSYAPAATSGYAAPTTTSSSTYPTQVASTGGYAPATAAASKYAPASGHIAAFSQPQGSVPASDSTAAQSTHVLASAASSSANSSSTAPAAPAQPPVPPQMHYAAGGMPPGMQYGANMYPQYPFFPTNAMAYGLYNPYNYASQAYPQGQSNYPPTTPGTYVGHSGHSGMAPRNYGAHPYGNPGQGGAGVGTTSAYTAAPAAGYSLNTSSGGAGAHSSGGASGYDDITSSASTGAQSAYGAKDKESAGYGMGQQGSAYQAQHLQRGGYGYGVPNQGYQQSAANYLMQQQPQYYAAQQGYKYQAPPAGHGGSNQSSSLKFQQ